MALILYLSSRSSLPSDSPSVSWMGQYVDEIGHLGEYGVLGVLAYAALRPLLSRRNAFVTGLALCFAFALTDEAFQSSIPDRTAQFTDIVLDGVGAVSALTFMAVLGPRAVGYLRRRGRGETAGAEARPVRPFSEAPPGPDGPR